MKRLVVVQNVFQDCPELDEVITRDIPEIHDLKDWPKHMQEIAYKYLTVPELLVVEHLCICSTPPTVKKANWNIQQVINKLYHVFGTTYILGR